MRLLFIKSQSFLPIVGSDISMFERLELLKQHRNWEVQALALADGRQLTGTLKLFPKLRIPIRHAGRQVQFTYREVAVDLFFGDGWEILSESGCRLMINEFDRRIASYSPDLIITNLRDFSALEFTRRHWSGPAVFFATEDEYPRRSDLVNHDSAWLEQIAESYSSIANVIVASNFLRESLKASWNIEAKVFINAVNIDHYSQDEPPGKYITCMSPYTNKGIDLFINLARALPERPFFAAGGVGPDYRKKLPLFQLAPNLVRGTFTPDVRSIYRDSRLVLAPSLWEEGFSRVTVEALAASRPVLASGSGGMREAGGAAAIYLPVRTFKSGGDPYQQDLPPWIEAITRLDDLEKYAEQVLKAREYTAWYRSTLQSDISRMSSLFAALIKHPQ